MVLKHVPFCTKRGVTTGKGTDDESGYFLQGIYMGLFFKARRDYVRKRRSVHGKARLERA